MLSLPIRSRWGNLLLLAMGFIFVVSSGALLFIAIRTTWGYAGLADYAVIAMLIFTSVTGGWLISGARANLRSPEGASRVGSVVHQTV